MSKTIALFNQSGGVGKSTLTMNIGYTLSQQNHKVLLVDMDPQASLTMFMGIDPVELPQSIYESVVGDESIPIYRDIYGCDVVPANINLAAAELELVSAMMREMRLRDALKPVRNKYDFILIDCPPSLGLLSVLSLVAASHVLVPIQTQFKSFQGTELLLNTVARLRKNGNRSLKFAGFIPTMFDSRTAQETRTQKAIQEQLSPLATVFPPVPKSIAFADASENRVPLALYNRRHPALKVIKSIAKGLEELS